MKDNFSIQSNAYAKYRPTYPQELYDFIIPLVNKRKKAWDCGTGNGQVAYRLAEHFEKVLATDISEKQIRNARKKLNIEYLIESAEKTSFADHTFDLITVGQAIHWFDLERFYSEVKRTLKPGGIIAVFGYSLVRFNHEIDKIIHHFHDEILGDYWDDARMLIENHYRDLPFPFKEIPSVLIGYRRTWTLLELTGYLSTWSALQNYIQKNQTNPLPSIVQSIKDIWGNSKYQVGETPVFSRIGRS